MSIQTKTHGWTEEQLMSLPDIGHKYELVDGRIEISPAGSEHGRIAVRLSSMLSLCADKNRLGAVFDSSTGFWMANGNLRSPDVSFVSSKRLKQLTKSPKGFLHGSPDLAVEILSPSDSARRVNEKVVEYSENHTVLVWVINPANKTATVYRGASTMNLLTIEDALSGEGVVPGFTMSLQELFAEPQFN